MGIYIPEPSTKDRNEHHQNRTAIPVQPRQMKLERILYVWNERVWGILISSSSNYPLLVNKAKWSLHSCHQLLCYTLNSFWIAESAGGIEIWNLSWVLPRGHYSMSFCYTSEPLLSEAWYLDFFYSYCLLKTRAQSVSYPFLVIYTFANCQFWSITAEKFGLMRIYFENLLRK